MYNSFIKKQTFLNGKTSRGDPSGSNLRPLSLINIYDFIKAVIFFANDTKIYFEHDELTRLSKTVNKELKKGKPWLDCNTQKLNIE